MSETAPSPPPMTGQEGSIADLLYGEPIRDPREVIEDYSRDRL